MLFQFLASTLTCCCFHNSVHPPLNAASCFLGVTELGLTTKLYFFAILWMNQHFSNDYTIQKVSQRQFLFWQFCAFLDDIAQTHTHTHNYTLSKKVLNLQLQQCIVNNALNCGCYYQQVFNRVSKFKYFRKYRRYFKKV